MADARARAESLAKLAGVELGEVLTISTSAYRSSPVRTWPAGRSRWPMHAPAPDIVPGQQSVSVQIHVMFAIR